MTDNKHLVLVYGSLRQGHGNHCLLIKSEFMGRHILTIPYVMADLGSFPGLVPTSMPHEIVTELYEVDDVTMERLDILEGYPMFYNRTKIATEQGDAWIYHLNTGEATYHECSIVQGGDWSAYLKGEDYENYLTAR